MLKNPKEKLFTAILLLAFCYALFSLAVSAKNDRDEAKANGLSAKAAVLFCPESGDFLIEKNADLPLPMASTTKIMTALVALENADPDTVVSVAGEATGIEGSSLYLEAGERLTLRELLYALMLRSANDAAAAIAYAVSGSLDGFVALMNEKAEGLGLLNTHFENPHGLDAKTHYTSAKDLAKITAEAMKNDLFRQIVSTKSIRIQNSDGLVRLLTNHNRLLSSVDGCIGVKTGFTQKSGRCLVTAAERGGLMMIAVTLSAPSDWKDHESLLNFGFSILEKRTAAAAGDYRYSLPAVNGQNERVSVCNREDFAVVCRKSDGKIKKEVRLSHYLCAPIAEGEKVGEIVFFQDGRRIGSIGLFAESGTAEVKKGFFKRIFTYKTDTAASRGQYVYEG